MSSKYNFIKKTTNTTNKVGKSIGDIGSITSVSKDGLYVNIENIFDAETRDIMNMAPYGIVSSPPDGIVSQIIHNGENVNSCVGVFDEERPNVKPGEMSLYTKYGSSINMLEDGSIEIKSRGDASITLGADGIINISGTRINLN